MKIIHRLIIGILLAALVPSICLAERVTIDGLEYELDKPKSGEATVYRGDEKPVGNLEIPSEISYGGKDYNISKIGIYAFNRCKGLTSVNIPSSVTIIGESAFYGCEGLTSVNIPSSVTIIGESAFYGCSGLTSISIPSSVTAIGEYTFGECRGLTSIDIPNSVTSIEEYAFEGCDGLTSIDIPNSVTSIGKRAFAYCEGLTSVIIPSSVTYIGIYAFWFCSNLTSIYIPSSVSSIEEATFKKCISLSSIIIPSSVTSIGREAFEECISLSSVTIPSSVTSIGRDAFYGCHSLTSIRIPSSVTSIGESAFYDCGTLTTIICEAITPPDLGKDMVREYTYEKATLYVPEESLNAYKSNYRWRLFNHIEAMAGKPKVERIELNTEDVEIEEGSFFQLTAKVYPEDVEDKSVTWMSSDEYVAKVYQDGLVVALNPGTAFITATTSNGVEASCFVTVKLKTGVEGVDDDSKIGVRVMDGVILVKAPEGTPVEVYSLTEKRVAATTEHRIEGLTHGIYIVLINGKPFKVIV